MKEEKKKNSPIVLSRIIRDTPYTQRILLPLALIPTHALINPLHAPIAPHRSRRRRNIRQARRPPNRRVLHRRTHIRNRAARPVLTRYRRKLDPMLPLLPRTNDRHPYGRSGGGHMRVRRVRVSDRPGVVLRWVGVAAVPAVLVLMVRCEALSTPLWCWRWRGNGIGCVGVGWVRVRGVRWRRRRRRTVVTVSHDSHRSGAGVGRGASGGVHQVGLWMGRMWRRGCCRRMHGWYPVLHRRRSRSGGVSSPSRGGLYGRTVVINSTIIILCTRRLCSGSRSDSRA